LNPGKNEGRPLAGTNQYMAAMARNRTPRSPAIRGRGRFIGRMYAGAANFPLRASVKIREDPPFLAALAQLVRLRRKKDGGDHRVPSIPSMGLPSASATLIIVLSQGALAFPFSHR
jgi:hypothetical protein